MVFKNAKWIWINKEYTQVSEYADFATVFSYGGGNATLKICAKSDYAAFINGKLVGFNQYRDFPDLKVYDEYPLSKELIQGKNTLCVLALSKNYHTSSHIANGKGIIFEIESQDQIICKSSKNVLSRLNQEYVSGKVKNITSQLGMSFCFKFNDDGWKTASANLKEYQQRGFCESQEIALSCKTVFTARPVLKQQTQIVLAQYMGGKAVTKDWNEQGGAIYDLGREKSGYLCFEIEAENDCNLVVAYGEHLQDGKIRQVIHGRDFSVNFKLKKGINKFSEYFLRFGCRYMSAKADSSIKIHSLGLNESHYPVNILTHKEGCIRKEIYDTCINTLINCMHEHYEDCPWREQAQYAMDSRNQMLCGYYAFKEYQFARAQLKAMIHYPTKEGMLRITSPSAAELSIGSFSLVYVLALKEYVIHSQDQSILPEVMPAVKNMMDYFISELKNGLLPTLKVWNFFEWSEGLDNDEEIFNQQYEGDKFALPLNAFFVVALECYAYLMGLMGQHAAMYKELSLSVRKQIYHAFYDKSKGTFKTYCGFYPPNYSEYSNVMALYAGCIEGKEKQQILKILTSENNGLVPLSLSNYIYKYEVLLKEGGFLQYIAEDIEKTWGHMLKCGATSFWETIKGEADFGGAGSLCHGWSATPVYCAQFLK